MGSALSCTVEQRLHGRPANLLNLHCFISRMRTENHGVGGSIPPLGTTTALGPLISLETYRERPNPLD
jgi:hypothetical protein